MDNWSCAVIVGIPSLVLLGSVGVPSSFDNQFLTKKTGKLVGTITLRAARYRHIREALWELSAFPEVCQLNLYVNSLQHRMSQMHNVFDNDITKRFGVDSHLRDLKAMV